MLKKKAQDPVESGVRVPDTSNTGRNDAQTGEVHVESFRTRARHQIQFTAVAFILLFAIMSVSFCRYAVVNKRELFGNGYNKRFQLLEKRNRRGSVISGDGETLAYSDDNNDRYYPFGEDFCHTVGFYINGGGGIEKFFEYEMLSSDISFKSRLKYDEEFSLYPGNDVYLTLNTKLQQYACEALRGGDYRGAVVITEPSTGEILAMVSMPGFEPEELEATWEYLRTDESRAPLVNRATQGIYPPGSTFKIVDCIELLQEDPDALDTFSYNCEDGTYTFNDESIHCFDYQHHGEQDLAAAFANSCNSAFAELVTQKLDENRFRSTLKKLMFDKSLPYGMPYSESHSQLLEEGEISTHNLMQVAIGQGTTGVSPLHMNMITMAVANDGVLMRPYMVDSVRTAEDQVLKNYSPRQAATLFDGSVAKNLRSLMWGVTHIDSENGIYGTASEFNDSQNYIAFGKTGTAEFGDGEDSHGWFTGFTVDAEDGREGKPELCITVLVENSGAGSDKAVPIARQILDRWYEEY